LNQNHSDPNTTQETPEAFPAELWVEATGAYQIPIKLHEPQQAAKHCVLVIPALGTPGRVYDSFARLLTQAGYRTVQMELRGYGKSSIRPGYRQNFSYRELVDDVIDVINWLMKNDSDTSLLLAGHSLGGQLAMIAAGLGVSGVGGLILIASGSPHHENFQGRYRSGLKQARFLFPILMTLMGYLPGKRLGFGGNEARGVIYDWLSLVRHNKFQLTGYPQINQQVSQYTGPVLSLRMAEDFMAPLEAVQAINQKLPLSSLDEQCIAEAELGVKADHFSWVKKPDYLIGLIDSWASGLGAGKY